ncbi:MAG: chromophore lyase CpcT/CpeT [Acidobacteriota bacterium]
MRPFLLRCSAAAVLLFLALPAAADDRRDHLASWMQGSFSSADQAESDEDFFDIRLEMVEIWQGRDDGPWLYIEQAAASQLDQPYRQRVYRLVEKDGGAIGSIVYEMPEPLRFAGAFRSDDPLAELSPDDLTEREGCTVFMRWIDDEGLYRGATVDDHCKSSLRGASYATSEVEVRPDRLETWDRGWSADGEYVWGAEKAGYVFKRTQ